MARRMLVQKSTPPSEDSAGQEPEYVGGYVDGAHVKLMYRTLEGELRVRQHVARYASYHKLDDRPEAVSELKRSKYVRRIACDEPCSHGGNWTRIEWENYKVRRQGVEHLQGHGVDSWEADVTPVKRHFADTSDKTCASPRIAHLDIETDSRVPFAEKEKMRVLCWTVVAGSTFDAVLPGAAHPEPIVAGCTQWSGVLDVNTDACEASLLEKLWAALGAFDVVAAWYGDGFDFPIVQARSKRHALGVDFRRWRWLDSLAMFKVMNMHVAETGEEKQSMALNSICQSMLGEGKYDFDAIKSWEEWEAGGERRRKLLEYNANDTMLLWKLEEKTKYAALFGTICSACNLFVETKSLHAHTQMDGMMLRLGRERGYHWPTKPGELPGFKEHLKGAWVMQPPEKAGILKNVHVADFSGLYPSIMISWNMSPETLKLGRDDRPTAKCPLTGTAFYTDQAGIFPIALKRVRALRKEWSDKKEGLAPNTPEWMAAERWAMAYKIVANAAGYGVLGLPVGRYYNPKMLEGVTQNGVWLIQTTLERAKEHAIRAVYGDTDSGMCMNVGKDEFAAFADWCNSELYPKMVSEQGCVENAISLAYEKAYERIVFCAAKKYCARLSHYKGKPATSDSKPEIKGLEYKRGDAILVARKLQGECIDLLMRECCEEPARFTAIVARYLEHVLNDALALDEVVMMQSLSQPIEDYKAKTPPPHVRVAAMLKKRGADVSVGTKVQYVVLDAKGGEDCGGMTVIPACDWTGEVDRQGLWEGRVWPPTRRLLENAFPSEDWSGFDKVGAKEPRGGRKKVDAQPDLFNPLRGKVLRLHVDAARGFNERGVSAVKAILELAKGGEAAVEVRMRLEDGSEVGLAVERKVAVEGDLLRRLRSLLGEKGVEW